MVVGGDWNARDGEFKGGDDDLACTFENSDTRSGNLLCYSGRRALWIGRSRGVFGYIGRRGGRRAKREKADKGTERMSIRGLGVVLD